MGTTETVNALDDDPPLVQCPICGEDVEEMELEPIYEHDLRARTIHNHSGRILLIHEHAQLASYDQGSRTADDMTAIALLEIAAIGVQVADEDRKLAEAVDGWLDDDQSETLTWAYESAEMRCPDGYVAFFDGDSSTWQLWALDRERFFAALERYAREWS